MSANKDVVRRYIDGFEKSDHDQILGCLTDDIRWTVFGAFRLEGKDAYDAEIENPAFTGSPTITYVIRRRSACASPWRGSSLRGSLVDFAHPSEEEL